MGVSRAVALVGFGLGMVVCGCGDSQQGTSGTGGVGTGGALVGAGGEGSVGGEAAMGGAATGGAGVGGMGGSVPPGWRSELYPDDWTPDFVSPSGHRIHDFSYAGYHNGESSIGTPVVTTEYDVVSAYGADPTGTNDSTAAVSQAIAAAQSAGGGVIHFPAGSYRFDGQLLITGSNIVLRGAGSQQSKLFFTKHVGMDYNSHITFRGDPIDESDRLLAVDGAAHDRIVKLDDATGLAVGDDVVVGWVITPAFIASHNMTGTWDDPGPFYQSWQPMFRRQVAAVDLTQTPHEVTLDVPLRYAAKVSDQASLRRQSAYLSECGVDNLSLANAVAWDDAWSHNQVHVLELDRVADCWVRQVVSFDPITGPTSGNGANDHLQSGGIMVRRAKRVTVADSEMHGGEHKGGGGNGYLMEIRQSSEVLFRDAIASDGRHNFIQNWGFGNTGCVWLRVHSWGGNAWLSKNFPGLTGYSEFHHTLALANLVDNSRFDDGWSIINRGSSSSGAGHAGTENVMWNTSGSGLLRSRQFGMGYVVGTRDIDVHTGLTGFVTGGAGTEPEDFTEGIGQGADLYPQSLYTSQLERRLSAAP